MDYSHCGIGSCTAPREKEIDKALYLTQQDMSLLSLPFLGKSFIFCKRRSVLLAQTITFFFNFNTVIKMKDPSPLKADFENFRILVLASDTWFHVTTKPANIETVATFESPNQRYVGGLPARCGIDSLNSSCTTETTGWNNWNLTPLLNPLEVYQVLNNQSVVNQVLSTSVTGQRLSYIAPSNPTQGLDFRTTTLASQSECTLITTDCLNPDTTDSDYFYCSSTFNSNNTLENYDGLNSLSYEFFADRNGSIELGFDNSTAPNPFYTFFNVVIGSAKLNVSTFGGELIPINPGSDQYFLRCETKFLNFTYTTASGALLDDANATPLDNPFLVNSLILPNFNGYFGNQLVDAGLVSSLQNNSFGVTKAFAEAYDLTFLVLRLVHASLCLV